jgi:hypothetical protein
MAADNHVYRRWNPPVETRLPDIHGWMQDIHSAHKFANRLFDGLNAKNPDPVVLDALTTAALVRYSRCFTSGIRARLSIDKLPTALPADIDLHKKLCRIRDSHIAHPVNQQEVHALYLILDSSPEATTGALGISSFSSTRLTLDEIEVSAMIKLCEKWTHWLQEELVREQTPLIPFASSLTRAELLSLPQDQPQPNSNIWANRRQTQR